MKTAHDVGDLVLQHPRAEAARTTGPLHLVRLADEAPTCAPSQIYILFAITLTTFAWLLKPEAFGQLSGRQLLAGGLLVFSRALT